MTAEKEEVVLFGGGCFWCIEPALSAIRGVTYVHPGYSGGTTHYPSYEQVCSQTTGHIEVVEVHYKPSKVSFRDLLEAFFSLHDPTSIDKQGNDVGPQYASAIFYTTTSQLDEARKYINKLEKKLKQPLATKLIQAEVFWPAEPEHKDYYFHNSMAPYSLAVIQPKLRKFAKEFNDIIKSHSTDY